MKIDESEFKDEWRKGLEAIRTMGFQKVEVVYDLGRDWHEAHCWVHDGHVIEMVFEEIDMPFCSLKEWVQKAKAALDRANGTEH